jgi:hypothetical protein
MGQSGQRSRIDRGGPAPARFALAAIRPLLAFEHPRAIGPPALVAILMRAVGGSLGQYVGASGHGWANS